jgi:hypothetical protein
VDWAKNEHRACVKYDVLLLLSGRNYYPPKQCQCDWIIEDFSNRPEKKMRKLLDEMVSEHEAVEYTSQQKDMIQLVSREKVEDYRKKLKEEAAWYGD